MADRTLRRAALWLSPHLLANTGRVLATVLKTPDDEVDDYLRAAAEMADASGGGITDPPQTVGDCPDWEDNRILDLAAAVGAFLIVSADADLTSMSPWRGRPIMTIGILRLVLVRAGVRTEIGTRAFRRKLSGPHHRVHGIGRGSAWNPHSLTRKYRSGPSS
jgi:hypothetical protein